MGGLFDVSGKVVLVTGGSRGIGEMIARGFVEQGAKVYISSRKAEVCEEVAEALSAEGTCISLPADLSTEAECRRLASEFAVSCKARGRSSRCSCESGMSISTLL